MRRWYICPVVYGNIYWAVLDLTDATVSRLRKVQEAWVAANAILPDGKIFLNLSGMWVYWLDDLPDTWKAPGDEETWTLVEESPLEVLATALDTEPAPLSAVLTLGMRVPIEAESLVVVDNTFLYFSCQSKHSEVSSETPLLSSDILDILSAKESEHGHHH